MLKNMFGGKRNLQNFLAKEKFTHRMLPPVTPWADMKPLDKRYNNKKSKEAKAKGKKRYYESLAKDLMDPANAPQAGHTPLRNHLGGHGQGKCMALVLFTHTPRGPPRHRCMVVPQASW